MKFPARNNSKQPDNRKPSEENTRAILKAIETGQIVVEPETARITSNKGKELVQRDNFFGYPQVQFQCEGTRRKAYVHKIVWLSVHGFIAQDHEIDHINADKSDARISNLQQIHWRQNMAKTRKDFTPKQVAF